MARRWTGSKYLGVEAKRFRVADRLRRSIEHRHYKQAVVGLIIEHSGDAFGTKAAEVLEKLGELGTKSRAEYATEEAIWGSMETRWSHPVENAKERPSSAASTTL